jgi:glucuronokinase
LGNPSDGYFGKTISFAMSDFRARVLVYPSGRLEIKPSKADIPTFENLEELHRITRWRGYYGGVRIVQALIVRLVDYCREQGIELPDRNFTIEYESSIPQRLGLGGSSAIITAALRALCQYYRLEIPLPAQANLALEAETRELGMPAGLQDRVAQAYQGLVYKDFSRDLMDSRGFGEYERLNPDLLRNVYVAYRTSLSEGTEVFHNDIRERWRRGDSAVVDAMKTWASYAEQGRECLLRGDSGKLSELIDANFDLRARIYNISQGNREMIETARGVGVSANFAGSGGAIVGLYRDAEMFARLTEAMQAIGVAVIEPSVARQAATGPRRPPHNRE